MGKFPEWQWNFPRITVRDLCKAAQAVSLRSPYKYDRSTFLYLQQARISYTFQYLLTYYTQELFRWSRKQHTHSGYSIVAFSLPSLHPLFCWVVSTKSAACVRLKRQLILELHIWTIIDTCAPPHTTEREREREGGREYPEPQMHFRRVQLLILPSHSPLLLSILSAIKYSMHREATRTKQVKISITKNAHVLRCPAKGRERERARERESEVAEADVTSHKKLLERVLAASCCLHAAPASFSLLPLLLLFLLGFFWGANRAAHAPKIIP